MADNTISVLPTPTFWELFHSMLRRKADDEGEKIRAGGCCKYLVENEVDIRKLLSETEAHLLMIVKGIYEGSQNGSAPRYAAVASHVKASENSKLEDVLEDYEAQMKTLGVHDAGDLKSILVRLDEEVRVSSFLQEIEVAKRIATTGQKFKVKGGEELRKGATAAITHLMKRMDATNLLGVTGRTRGSLKSSSSEIMTIYNENLQVDGLRAKIPTGLPQIDDIISFKRGQFVGILGYAGMRKTSLARSWAYNAASMGFNVLHITFEQSYDEELIQYALMHSRHPKFGGEYVLTSKDFDNGDLKPPQERFLFSTVLPDLKTLRGDILIEQPTSGSTWEAVKSLIHARNMTTKLDMVVIDYLTLVTPKSLANAKDEMNEIIKDCKNFALTFDNGAGLLIVTPVQGNREGKEEAGKHDGQWEMTGVFQYSEFDKSVDTMLSVYLDDDLKAIGEVLIGTAKSRRSDTIKVFRAEVDSGIGRIKHLDTGAGASSVAISEEKKEFIDDL
jgi:hypothetical protein